MRAKRWEWWLLGLAAALFATASVLEVSLWRPGFCRTDEAGFIGLICRYLDGAPLSFEVSKGALYENAACLLQKNLYPSLIALHALTWAGLILESFALFFLARRFFDERAALWSVLALLCSAMVFLRTRGLLCYAWIPAELLLMLLLFEHARGPLASLAFGASAALLCTEYDAWILAGLPLLALSWLKAVKGGRPLLAWSLAGFTAVLAVLLSASWHLAVVHSLARFELISRDAGSYLQASGQALQALCFGIDRMTPHLGVRWHSILPTWTLPLILLAAGRPTARVWYCLAWAALGMLPLLLRGGAGEPNRMIAAWPAFCMLAGFGAARFQEHGRAASVVLLLLLALGTAFEARAYARNLDRAYGLEYAQSASLLSLARNEPARRIAADFNYKNGAAWSFAVAGSGRGQDCFLLPWEFKPALKGYEKLAHELPISADQPPWLLVDAPPPALEARLNGVEAALKRIRNSLPERDRRARRDGLIRELSQRPDPVLASILLEQALLDSGFIGDLPKELLHEALQPGAQASSTALLWLHDQALKSGDQRASDYFCARAQALDPRRSCAP